jgi:STE24 endopeptidase
LTSLNETATPAIRRFWLLLWTAALGLVLLLLFATLADRPFDEAALRHFPLTVLEKGRAFTQEVSLVATLRAILSLVLLLTLCFHPLGARLLARIESIGGKRPIVSLLSVGTGVVLLAAVVELPFSFYLGHLHERLYGLTNQTSLQWLVGHGIDLLTDLALSFLLWIPLYALIRRWPRMWWAPASLVYVGFTGLMIFLAPIVLMPLEAEMVPVRDPEVRAMIHQLGDRAGVEVGTVQEMLVSAKSSRVNAMVTGLGPTKRVILYDTLLQQFEPAEVEVVMAHELAHSVNQDVATGWLLSGLSTGATLMVVAWVLRGMVGVSPLRMTAPHAARSLGLFLLLSSLMGEIEAPLHHIVSRQMEVRADRYALQITNRPEAFIRTFQKLARGNPGDVDPSPVVEFLSHSHPSVIHRIRMAEEAIANKN